MTQLAADDFNRADASPISGSWSTAFNFSPLQISGNQALGTAATFCASFYNGVTWPSNQWSRARLAGTSGFSGGVAVRLKSSTSKDGLVFVYDPTAHVCRLYEFVAGTPTQLGSDYSVTLTTSDYLGISVSGTSVSGLVNDAVVITQTCSITGGNAGIYTYEAIGPALDDWTGGDNASGAALAGAATDSSTATGTLINPGVRIVALKDIDTGAVKNAVTYANIHAFDPANRNVIAQSWMNKTTTSGGILLLSGPGIVTFGKTYDFLGFTADGSDRFHASAPIIDLAPYL